MKTLDEIKNAIAKHRDELSKKYKVKEIGVFGSYIRDEQEKSVCGSIATNGFVYV